MQLFTAREYLMMDVAAHHSMDHADWDDRLAWFKANEHQLEALYPSAKEPALYFAAVQAWRDVEAGKAIGYPISLDATASGLQFLSILAGDRNAAAITNVIDTGHRRDAYTIIYQLMCQRIGDRAKLERKPVKNALMTSLYGSRAVPRRVFGEGILLNTFYSTNTETIPHAWRLNQDFVHMWNPTASEYGWLMPDNFRVNAIIEDKIVERTHFMGRAIDVVRVVQGPTEQGRSIGPNMIHSIDGLVVREITRRCDYDPAKIARIRGYLAEPVRQSNTESRKSRKLLQLLKLAQHSGYLSARVLDYIDNTNAGLVDADQILTLIDSMPARPFKVLSTHDCFRVLPAYGNDIRKQYNLQLYLMAKSNMLNFLCSQLHGRHVNIPPVQTDFYESILEANYALS